MSGTAKMEFEIEGVKHSLYFGMTSTYIFQQKSFEEVARMEAQGIKADADNVDKIKTFAYVVYSGACNWADLNDLQRPKYSDIYMLVEKILSKENEAIQVSIWETWNNSLPVAEMLERLNGVNKEKPKKSQKKK